MRDSRGARLRRSGECRSAVRMLASVISEYVGRAFVVDADGDEVEVQALLRVEDNGWWGGDLIGPVNWLRFASSRPLFEFALSDRRVGAAFVSEFDQADTMQRVMIAGVGEAPF
jgi:hypothetical protein